jgi:hypothetical protein
MKNTLFTTQEVINMGAEMYDTMRCSREIIKRWLVDLLGNGYASFDLERIFDLIVG